MVKDNGNLNVKTREFGPHDPGIYVTAGHDNEYDPDAKCPMWDFFLSDLDEPVGFALSPFTQKIIGYSLTQYRRSTQKTFWVHGAPGGGKTTVIDAIRAIFGAYAGDLTYRNTASQFGLSVNMGSASWSAPRSMRSS